ncbi:tubulin--tyrosine ligase-like protein 12 [Paragonimus westermani]|uniref:Tubulin--tyrosine ligase-like protein 12 n=1 Tax=Paragonimus westermani TaxID=34504 RepID=A0A5J4NCL1_9TREM|nr:tubulin--tyrosine ligase-like protein 12 [Paragonimus westermani]
MQSLLRPFQTNTNGIVRLDFAAFLLLHEYQLRSCDIPGHLWRRLHEKLLDEVYDAGQFMVLNRVEFESDEEQNDEEGDCETVGSVWQVTVDCEKLVRNASNSIFLFDHAWTFELSSLRSSLIALPSLRLRMAELMDIDQCEVDEATVVDRICDHVWKFCRHYKVSLQSQGGQLGHGTEVQRWYVLDEVGSRISHSDNPNARIVPFFYTPRGICYSLLWPLRDLQHGGAITVDYIEHVKDPYLRQFYLVPWHPGDFSRLPIEHSFILSDTFFQSHRVQETLPCFSGNPADPLVATQAHPLLVYSDMALVRQHLTDPRFRLVDSPENARLLWLYDHFKDFK